MKHGVRPDPAIVEQAFLWVCGKMAPAARHLDGDFFSWEHFMRVVPRLNMKASPGYPYCRNFSTVGLLLGYEDGSVDESQAKWLWEMVKTRVSAEADLIRVFIKPEPHRVKKILEKRWRLIQAVSIVDQVIDQLLLGHLIDSTVAMYGHIPVFPGWSPMHGGWRYLREEWFGLDRSAWDWTVPLWLLELLWRVLEEMTLNARSVPLWLQLMRKRFDELFREAKFILSDGTVWVQLAPGVMKSGSVITALGNSIMQLLLHVIVCLELGRDISELLVFGDDTHQRDADEEYCSALRRWVKVKPPEKGEFCSRVLKGTRVEPQNFLKHVANFMHTKDEDIPVALLSLQLEYARSDRLEFWQRLAVKLAPESLRTRSWLLDVFDNAPQ